MIGFYWNLLSTTMPVGKCHCSDHFVLGSLYYLYDFQFCPDIRGMPPQEGFGWASAVFCIGNLILSVKSLLLNGFEQRMWRPNQWSSLTWWLELQKLTMRFFNVFPGQNQGIPAELLGGLLHGLHTFRSGWTSSLPAIPAINLYRFFCTKCGCFFLVSHYLITFWTFSCKNWCYTPVI